MKPNRTSALFATMLMLPGWAVAGGYGEAGVRDATVAPPATATASVWCPKLRTEVPVALQNELDCGEAVAVGSAEPKVAPSRFTRGFFGLPAHEPSGVQPNFEDGDGTPFPVAQPAPNAPQQPSPPANQSIGKWERLSQLGVNPQNIQNQSQSFTNAFNDYFSTHGASGDWSNFNP